MWIKAFAREASLLLSDRTIAVLMFLYHHRYIPRFRHPRSLSEKINYVKLFNKNPVRSDVVDRVKAREYVASHATDCHLVELLWVGRKFTKEVWESLPLTFVLKANHGSKMTKVVDKRVDEFQEVVELASSWQAKDYSRLGREWVYKELERYLVAERMLEVAGAIPDDYKFFVSDGRVELVQVDFDRFGVHRRNLYNREFEMLSASMRYPTDGAAAKEVPECFEDAVRVAEQLGRGFDFMRIDLYLVDGKVYFGELTNTPENGFARIAPKTLDFELGSKLPDYIDR